MPASTTSSMKVYLGVNCQRCKTQTKPSTEEQTQTKPSTEEQAQQKLLEERERIRKFVEDTTNNGHARSSSVTDRLYQLSLS